MYAVEDIKRNLSLTGWVNEWLSGAKSLPKWESSDGLIIPTLGDGSPSLLLHDLGSMTTMPVVENLFRPAGAR